MMSNLERKHSLGVATCNGPRLAGVRERCGICQVEWMWYYTKTLIEIWEGEEEGLYERIQATTECLQRHMHPERGEDKRREWREGEERKERERPQLQCPVAISQHVSFIVWSHIKSYNVDLQGKQRCVVYDHWCVSHHHIDSLSNITSSGNDQINQ